MLLRNASSLRKKILKLKSITNKYKIICITDTPLSAENVKDAEILD